MQSNPTCNAVALSALGGLAAQLLHVPMPWMVGPMLIIAMSKICRVPVRPLKGGRQAGQMIIGVAIGLVFTPALVAQVANTVAPMLLAGAASILIGAISALPVARLAGVDIKTAFFASVPGGAAEMVQLGGRYGAAADFIAMAQSLRLMLVVLIIPPLFVVSGVTGAWTYSAAPVGIVASGLVMLFLIGGAGGLVFQKIGAPTPWLLGPLLCSIGLAASGHSLSAMPIALSSLGQCLIGCSLGSRFDRDFLTRAPRLMSAAGVGIFLTISLSTLLGVLLAALHGIAIPSMILATAPGGIAEMGITAKMLGLGVPLVATFHVTRLLMILTLTAPVFRFALYLNRHAGQ